MKFKSISTEEMDDLMVTFEEGMKMRDYLNQYRVKVRDAQLQACQVEYDRERRELFEWMEKKSWLSSVKIPRVRIMFEEDWQSIKENYLNKA